VTTAGSDRVASVRSIRAVRVRSAVPSIGAVITRALAAPHTGQGTDDGAVPIGRPISTSPSAGHRYAYLAIACTSFSGNHFLGNY
jgi:hypothetical protein